MTWWTVAIGILLWAGSLLAQKSQVICSSSFDWARNDKGQDPCVVAALLQGNCRHTTDVTISRLAENEVYLGPDPKNTHDVCACNSVVYSLLSVCAACQDRFFVDWPSWTKHCALSYLATFPMNISSNIIVPSWAFNSMSASCTRFDMDEAIRVAITKTQTLNTGITASSMVTTRKNVETPVNLPDTTEGPTSSRLSSTGLRPASTQGSPTGDAIVSSTASSNGGLHKSLIIAASVVGSIVGVAVVILGVYLLFLGPRRLRVRNPSATRTPVYKKILGVKIPQIPTARDQGPSFVYSPLEIDTVNRNPENVGQAASRISLPSYLYHTSPDKEPYSPAVESSEFTIGGHSESHSRGHLSAPNSATSTRPNPFTNPNWRRTARGNTLPSTQSTGQ